MNKRMLAGVALTGLGIKALDEGKDRVLGRATVYHGTDEESKKKILSEGIRANYGGVGGGASDIADKYYNSDTTFADNAKNKAYLTKQKWLAREFADAKVSKQYAEGSVPDTLKQFIKANLGLTKGEVVKVTMPYRDYDKTKIDPDVTNITETALKEFPSYSRSYLKGIASYSEKDINAKHIVGNKDYTPQTNIGEYIKDYPGRFLTGVGLATGGGILAGKGVAEIAKSLAKRASYRIIGGY